MTEPNFPAAGPDVAGAPSTPRRPPVNWALVLGLGALALLWPLLGGDWRP